MIKEIRQCDVLTDTERKKLFDWGDDIFGAADLNLRWRPKDLHFLIYIDDEPISHVGILKHEVSVAGKPVLVGGVGGVVTRPQWQKAGLARELMGHATRFLENWQVEAGLLFCLRRRVPYYESQGWQVVHHPVLIQQAGGEINSPLEVMVQAFTGPWPAGEIVLNSFPW